MGQVDKAIIVSDRDIVAPYGITDTPLIMVISSSPVYRDTLETYLLDFDYRVAGPFENVDQGHAFLRRKQPDLIIFDAITSQSELISFSTMLRNEATETPTLVLHNGSDLSVSHTIIDFIFPPINPTDLQKKVSSLLTGVDDDQEDPVLQFLEFVNLTIETIIELAPEFALVDIKDILNEAITILTVRNSEITARSEEILQIQIKDRDRVNLSDLSTNFRVFLEEVVEGIDARMEAEWGKSLIEDVLEAVTIKLRKLNDPAIKVVESMGKGYSQVIEKFDYAVPSLDNLDKRIVVAKLLLTDWGPEMGNKVSSDPAFGKEFDEKMASQLLTLVGQGSNYHEGIFGPVPIPRTNDIIAIIWSKLIDSNIKDERMGGKTLVIVTIGFKKSLLNSIPSREDLTDIFSEIDRYEHEQQIDELTLQKIAKEFNMRLK